MLREDCQSKRIDVFPVDAPPHRWIRFLDEVTRGDSELAGYLEWIAASALTGLSPQLLFFFYGSGRNGKGVFLRLLAKILRGPHFTAFIRPEEVEYKRGGEDKNKRLFGRLRGMRLAFTPETVSGNLDWTLLKMLTGGDSLTGARVYQDERSFAPSHTLILTTNDRPTLPPTAAFKGRLRFVPFLARFEGDSIDHALETTLEREMSAILYRLMKVTPGVWNGDKPPACVLQETADLLDENDVARPFIEACLIEDSDAVVPVQAVSEAVSRWQGLKVADPKRIMDGLRSRYQTARKRAGTANAVSCFVGIRLAETSS